jgi:oligopeptide/dipeptide ABC transporter ATP-binding protein
VTAKISLRGLGHEYVNAFTRERVLALDGLSLDVAAGEFVTMVGPSGCGKSTLLGILAGLVTPTRGEVLVDGRPVTGPGRDRGVVFQEFAILPWRTVERNIAHGLEIQGVSRSERAAIVRRFVELIGLQGFENKYPHELSGGMRQRVLIGMAFSCEPTLVIADEPTTALDVTTQAQILRLLEDLQAERRVATLFVTHDLGVVAHLAHRVAVMYAGCLVESAATRDLFRAPAHPYTQGLLAQAVRADARAPAGAALDGLMPVLSAPPGACPFRERCPRRLAICDQAMPALREIAPGHAVACHLHEAA